ncbi:MAG: superoxide dismutase family protein [Candidatus Neomarinimicrobiota bacterium]|jgi:Cu-Zn family superoxide dismutase
MKTKLLMMVVLLLQGCAYKSTAIAHIKGLNSNPINGVAKFIEQNGLVTLVVQLRDTDSESLAIHIHEYGNCDSVDGKSAGGHWDPTNEDHGEWGVPPFHSGDIGNINTNKDNTLNFEMKDLFKRWSISNPGKSNIIGRAIIVHSGVDDYTSQPSGAAGGRIGCGVIK